MPWEKSFDIDDVTDKAIAIFIDKGYEGTSMSDLIDGMGINKGSLYNAFGSKRELFSRALRRYDLTIRAAQLNDLAQKGDPVAAISGLFDHLIAEASSGADYRGCLLVNTALELPHQPDSIKEIVRESLGAVEAFFDDMIRKGQARGSISKSIDPEETATSLLSLVIGLRVLSRGTSAPGDLAAIRSAALRLIS